MATLSNGTTTWTYPYDANGLRKTRTNGTDTYTYIYNGNVLSISGSMATTLGTLNPLTYRGYVYDHEYGLYYLQSRYYNPEWGRFINADALVSTGSLLGNNMFAYCLNNPIMFADSTGTRAQVWRKHRWDEG